MDLTFYRGKKVFITGHTGFKGSWMCRMLLLAGAEITGYALDPPTQPALFELLGLKESIHSVRGDIRDRSALTAALKESGAEIVLHLAAQPIVRESYRNPVYTFETNVMGTVNILEAVRENGNVRSFVNVTTDKVYLNREWNWGYRETDRLGGYDPYSNSKSCSELVTASYRNSFFSEGKNASDGKSRTSISTARAGNVIGGGDFAADRIIPDCVRAAQAGREIIVRNPYSIRPYQHVLEPVTGYLMLAQRQYEDPARYEGSYNFGPSDADCITTGMLADIFCSCWENITWKNVSDHGPHEANFLKLDCSLSRSVLKWKPLWDVRHAVDATVEWTKAYLAAEDVGAVTDRQIERYLTLGRE